MLRRGETGEAFVHDPGANLGGGGSLGIGAPEGVGEGGGETGDAAHGRGVVGAVAFAQQRVGDPARPDELVRRPEHTALVEKVGHLGGGELVVRRPDHGPGAQPAGDLGGEHPTQRRGHQQVERLVEQVVGVEK